VIIGVLQFALQLSNFLLKFSDLKDLLIDVDDRFVLDLGSLVGIL
jgi:hypothetical protein